ncbi:VOC family protein [Ilumatobacter nonamiensis]|uniref:VOC family protein n=1 Tax=Ilumatobacter nonamiensis TaxID=467093 RepID=UPI00034BA5A4|nr:VOC family protein [Ilumatobacter nonamiensis]
MSDTVEQGSDAAAHELRPTKSRWTHIALRVKDIDTTIDFYERYTDLELLDRREDEDGYGAWLGHSDQKEFPFVLVLAQFFEGRDPFAPAPLAKLAPFNHLGIELPTKAEVDATAARAEAEGCLAMPARMMPDPIGYICMLEDPDGNLVEFSFDQGVYETVREKWG